MSWCAVAAPLAVLGSECCHWKTDEHVANSDEEVGAAELSMAMCPDGGLLLLGSSVGMLAVLFRQYRISKVWATAPLSVFHSDEWLRNDVAFCPYPLTTSENYPAALPRLLAGRVA